MSKKISQMKLFRELTPAEELEMRHWAQLNYRPFTDIQGIWHPVVQDECRKINQEAEVFLDEVMHEDQKEK